MVLSSGIDSLVLSLGGEWINRSFLDLLDACRAKAELLGEPITEVIPFAAEGGWTFQILPHGKSGYRWLLLNPYFSLKILDSLVLNSRPNVHVEIRSETLWTFGPEIAVARLLSFVQAQGLQLSYVKVSRVDLCLDLWTDADFWEMALFNFKTCRAKDVAFHTHLDRLQGVTVGKGQILARLYDKVQEIKQKGGKKEWMFAIWNRKAIHPGTRIIRIEFQLRREKLRELGVDEIGDLWTGAPSIWRYCTESWLKFETNPGEHHTQRKLLYWWKGVQQGYAGVQDADLRVPARASRADLHQALAQILGFVKTAAALGPPGEAVRHGKQVLKEDLMRFITSTLDLILTREDYTEDIWNRLGRYRRIDPAQVPQGDADNAAS